MRATYDSSPAGYPGAWAAFSGVPYFTLCIQFPAQRVRRSKGAGSPQNPSSVKTETALGLAVWDCHRTPDGFYGLPAPLERRTR